ncbi:MAG: hypothetical protein NT161_03355 [Candidatus Nomurabacteria bacterium]|nr:hypothetical protein [Candidatus Nomurabacteria bacterium]
MLPEKIIIIAVMVSFVGDFIYLRSMYLGHAKPNLVSWFIWMLAPFLGVYFQLKAGAGFSVFPVFAAGFCPLLVIIYSLILKNGYWKITLFDLVCGILALLALVLYVFTHSLEISILFVILSDGLAAIPTIVKSWKFPETENAYLYLLGIFNNIIGLLIIKEWSFSIYSLGIYFIVINSIISFTILHKKFFKKEVFS